MCGGSGPSILWAARLRGSLGAELSSDEQARYIDSAAPPLAFDAPTPRRPDARRSSLGSIGGSYKDLARRAQRGHKR